MRTAQEADPVTDHPNPYSGLVRRKVLFIAAIGVLCFLVIVISVGTGTYHIGFVDTLKAIFFLSDGTDSVIIWRVRMPRIVGAIVVGAALSIAGAVMQCILRNPLASPYTLGISNAAGFGAAFALMISYWGLFSGNIIGDFLGGTYGMAIGALVFSMLAVLILVFLSKVTAVTPEAMVLMGVALSAIFSAALSALQYFADDQTLADIVFWQFGDVSKASWNELAMLSLIVVPILAYFFMKRMDYNAMDAGDDLAKSLGIDTKRTRLLGMVAASTITAVCVSVVGIIGFVGLLGPHIVRRVIGNDNRFLLPASVLVGILILLVADYVGRVAFTQVIPVGIITSFLGGPLFIYILIRGYRKNAVR
ncbi:MAG: FecCD family ABC transporter permease [Candidatus Methanomethylophilaceae archaeon]